MLRKHTAPIVYGDDDRLDVYEHPNAALKQLARASTVALIPRENLQRPLSGEIRLQAGTLEEVYGLCADQRFLSQPVAASCSGVLIDDDLVLTAAHCFEEIECVDFSFVFDFLYRAPDKLEPLSANDIYACQRVVTQRRGAIDFAVVQLDRPVSGRLPVALRQTLVSADEPLSVISTGSGLPIKIDSNARVISPRVDTSDFFELESDTFGGSSGGGVFDAEQKLVGVLVRGGLDYIEPPDECAYVNQREYATTGKLPDGDLGHEEATYVRHVVERLCGQNFPSKAICGIETRCGDGICSSDESRLSCPSDCDPCDDAGVCGARGDVRFASTAAVKQERRARTPVDGGCALSSRASGASAWWLLGLFGLALGRRRRTVSPAP